MASTGLQEDLRLCVTHMYITQPLLIIHPGLCELDNGRRLQLIGVAFYGGNRSGTPYNRRHLSLELQAGWRALREILVVADSVVQLGWFVLRVAGLRTTG